MERSVRRRALRTAALALALAAAALLFSQLTFDARDRTGPHTREIASGATLVVPRADLADGATLALKLLMPPDALGPGPLPTRILAPDGRRIERSSSAEPSGDGVRFEISAAWLSPGRYLIEVTTRDRSHFPLRRYALEVE